MIQSIEGAEKAMSMARANIQTAKSSKEDRNKVVTKANEVVGALLIPSRHAVGLLSGLGALFSPFKQVSSALAVSVSFSTFRSTTSHTLYLGQTLLKHELGRPEKDVRVAIVHFDLV